MKKLFSLMLCAALCFSGLAQPCTPGPCPVISTPHVDGGPVFTIDRYLGRAIQMSHMAERRMEINGGYNDQLYCSDIAMATDLRGSYLRRVAGVYGNESQMNIGAPYHIAAQDAINDLLEAFDCAGLDRPIVEAYIHEYITNDVNNVPIPPYVSLEFNQPGGNFNDAAMVAIPGSNIMDVTQVMARMWFYYLATQYIDMGYLAIHAGWLDQFTINDQPNYTLTNDLFQRIRNYAAIHHPQHFVVITADTDHDIYVGGPGSQNLLLDFNTSNVMPDEAIYPGNMANSQCFGEEYTELAYYKMQPGLYNSTGGISPMGTDYDKTPVLFSFGWGVHVSQWPTPTHNGMPWGWDEVVWFMQLGDQCQAYWLTNAIFATKNDLVYRGYMSLPLLVNNFWVYNPPGGPNWKIRYSPMRPNNNITGYDNAQLYDGIKNRTWKTTDYFSFGVYPDCREGCTNCDEKVYKARVTKPTGSSVYQWHVYNVTQNSWLPVSYGPERVMSNLPAATYLITCVENNFGFPGQNVKSIEKQIVVTTDPCDTREYTNAQKPGKGNNGPASASAYAKRPQGDISTPPGQFPHARVSDYYQARIVAYPNPAKDKVNFEYSLPAVTGQLSLNITGITGQRVKEIMLDASTGEAEWDAEGIPSGVYIYELKDGNMTVYTGRVSIAR